MERIRQYIDKYKSMPDQIKASIWFVICGFLQKGISLLTTPIFSRILSTSEYGLFNVFQSWQGIIIIFASLNLASGVYLRGLIKYDSNQLEFTDSIHSLFYLVFFCAVLLYSLFKEYLNGLTELPTNLMYMMFVDIFLQTVFHFWSAKQRVKYKYRLLVALTLVNVVLRPLLGIFSVLNFEDKVAARIYSIVIADTISFGYIAIEMIFHRGIKISTSYWDYALKYNIPLVPHYLSQIVLNTSDRIMINNIVNSSKAGIYSLAYSAATILMIVNQSILNTYNPWMYQKIKDKQYEKIPRVSYSLLLIVAIVNLIIIICAPEIIAIMAPPSYYEARWVIPPVAMSVYFMFLYSLFANFEFYYEKTKYMMIASITGALLNIVLNLIFINKYGYLAAGYTTLLCYMCYSLAHYILMKKIIRKELPGVRIYNKRIILLISLLFILCGSSALLLYPIPIVRYLVLLGIGILLIINKKKILNLKKLLK